MRSCVLFCVAAICLFLIGIGILVVLGAVGSEFREQDQAMVLGILGFGAIQTGLLLWLAVRIDSVIYEMGQWRDWQRSGLIEQQMRRAGGQVNPTAPRKEIETFPPE